ncbi:hypothetical protein D0Z08_24975 [Nocardioides immobilis]|uniref:Uncharacterized protein n=1 Tax=Nocardioides immobilis TaxID=2049295 RepID=A0A417XV56_9ACTN|nr:hypothetical protein [Nocardioides immobilis]RHW24368.1 hypothetical protein D0Z08_24975 [Nocardioides immobilis]
MTTVNDRLSAQLRASRDDAMPDLDRLTDGAIASGRRRRNLRRAGIALVGVGAAAGVGVFGVVVTSGDDAPTVAEDDSWAAGSESPEAPPGPQVGQELDLGEGVTGTVTDDEAGVYVLGGSTLRGSGSGFVVIADGPTSAVEDWWSRGFGTLTSDYPGITVAVTMADAEALGMLGKVDKVPVTVPDGWTCEWFLDDDKAACQAADGGTAGLVIRDAADREAWVGDPDKGADPAVYLTEAHDGTFISVQPGRGTTDAEIQALGEGLVWVE